MQRLSRWAASHSRRDCEKREPASSPADRVRALRIPGASRNPGQPEQLIPASEAVGAVGFHQADSVAFQPGRFLIFQQLESRSEQGTDGELGEAAAPSRSVRGGRSLGPSPRKQPPRLDRGQLDDLQDDLRRDRDTTFIIVPGPDRNPQPPCHLRSTAFSVQIQTQSGQPFREVQLGTNRFRKRFPTSHIKDSCKQSCVNVPQLQTTSGTADLSERLELFKAFCRKNQCDYPQRCQSSTKTRENRDQNNQQFGSIGHKHTVSRHGLFDDTHDAAIVATWSSVIG